MFNLCCKTWGAVTYDIDGPVARFVPDREFRGTDRSARRDGPVQFEKEEEEDPFGLNNFLRAAKEQTGEKRSADDSGSSRRDHKRRKE